MENEKRGRRETKKHIEAFLFYSDLKQKDDSDPMRKTADKFGVTMGTLYNWSHDFNWKDKYEEELRKAREKAIKAYQKKVEKAAMDNVQKTIELFYQVADNIGPMPNSPNYTVKDFETMSKLLTLLTGGATERVESNNTEKLSDEDRKALDGLNDTLEALMNTSSTDILDKIKD